MDSGKKTNLILLCLILILTVTFVISLFGLNKGRKPGTSVKTSLVNPSYKNEIKAFELRSGDEVLDFYKKGNTWYTGYYTDEGAFFLPAREEKISNFISDLTAVKTYEKIVTGKNKAYFGLGDEDAFIITYSAGENLYELRFGDRNFSDTGHYFMSQNSVSIYLSDKTFESYLYAGITQWHDPYLLTRSTKKKYSAEDFMNLTSSDLTELRHGGLSYFTPSENETCEKILRLDLGDTSFYVLKFYADRNSESNEHHVLVSYSNPLSSAGQETEIEYTVKISDWTFRKIFPDS